MELEDEKWSKVKQKLKLGDEVEGIVKVKPPFGDFIDIGVGFPGLLLIPDMSDLTPEKYRVGEYSLIGSIIKARIIWFEDQNKQIILTQKPVEE